MGMCVCVVSLYTRTCVKGRIQHLREFCNFRFQCFGFGILETQAFVVVIDALPLGVKLAHEAVEEKSCSNPSVARKSEVEASWHHKRAAR